MEIFKLSKSLGFTEKLTGIKICDLSLLAKWLREEHNIYVSPRESYAFDGTLEFVCTVNGVFVNHNFKDKPINRFENFEEAYEIGLQEALKLT